jgi:hypothetical protein
MGFGDKFKGLKKQAQKSVAEHRDQIDDAVGVVGMAVDKKTKGRHTQRIAKFGQKTSQAVDKFADEEQAEGATTTPAPTQPAAPEAGESAPRT